MPKLGGFTFHIHGVKLKEENVNIFTSDYLTPEGLESVFFYPCS